MLGNLHQTPASARPKYALGALSSSSEGGNPLRKGIVLALMALAGGLFLVLPDGDEDVVAVQAAGVGGPSDGLVIDDTPTTTYVSDVSGGSGDTADGAATAQVAVATEAALAGMEHNVRNGLAISSAGELMSQARAAAAALQSTSTTGPAVAAPSKAQSTTAAPATTAAATSTSASAETTAPAESTSSTDQADESTTSVDGSTTSSDTSGETTSTTAAPAGTTAPETTAAPETTVPATTATTTGSPETAGWVDTGNGVLVPPILLQIRHCESRGDYTAANPSSSARGAYQFLTGSWSAYGHKDRYGVNQAHLATPAQQDEAALITWQRDGTRPWNASRSCWG